MSALQDRIKKARLEHSMSAEAVAEFLTQKGVNISARTIYAYEKGVRQPSVAYLQGLVKYLDINSSWLLSGMGSLFVDDSAARISDSVDLSKMVFLPLIEMNASAGYGSLIEEKATAKDFIAFAKNWITEITITSPEHLLVFTVKGDSMEGEIHDGDLLIVNETMNDLGVEGTYVVCIDDRLYVKTLQRIPGNKIQVVSKNPKYPPFVVDLNSEAEHFQIIGKVIWSGNKTN